MSEWTLRVSLPAMGRTLELAVDGQQTTLEDLKALVASEAGAGSVDAVALWLGTAPLRAPPGASDASATVASLGLRPGASLTAFIASPPLPTTTTTTQRVSSDLIRNAFAQASAAAAAARGGEDDDDDRAEVDPDEFLEFLQSDPDLLQQLLRANPVLAEAAMSGDRALLAEVLSAQHAERREAQAQARREVRELERRVAQNPLDPEAQRLLAERIRQTNVKENFEYALQHNPEAFARVEMLWVRVRVNGHELLAMVDSGAQASVMSVEFAERCGIMRLVDTNFRGVVRGAGEAEMVGRVHACDLQIGRSFLPCSFSIVRGSHLDFLFGLDILRRHRAVIDLGENCLRINDESIPFLAEKDVPKQKE